MDLLEQLISSMSKEEMRSYKLFANRTGSGVDRKDNLLFDKLRKHHDLTFEQVRKRVLPGISANAYYRLRNRLFSDLSKTMLLLHWEGSSNLRATYSLLISRVYFHRKLPELGINYLKKAEKEALAAYQHELLDLIYSDLINNGLEMLGTDPSIYIKKRQDNQKELQLIRQTEEVLAMVKYRLRITQNYSSAEGGVTQLLERTVREFSGETAMHKSPKLRLQLFSVVSQFLISKRDYPSLQAYLEETWKQFNLAGIFNRESHRYRLQILAYLANACFKNGIHDKSLHYAEELHKAMQEYNGLHAEQFQFFYHNALVINYSVTDRDKAIEILEELKLKKYPAGQAYYSLFIHLNLAILWFDKGEPRKAIRHITRLYLQDQFSETDASLRLKIAVSELLIRYELRDEEVFGSRLQQVKKEYGSVLKEKSHEKELSLLNLLEENKDFSAIRDNEVFRDKALEFVKRYTTQSTDDSEVIKYVPWVNSLLKSEFVNSGIG